MSSIYGVIDVAEGMLLLNVLNVKVKDFENMEANRKEILYYDFTT
jgi:hypothetical protein